VYLRVSRGMPWGLGRSARSPRATTDLEWEIRVVVRKSTGVSNCSEISNAALRKSLASWESEGSTSGTFENWRSFSVVLLILARVEVRVVGRESTSPPSPRCRRP